MRSEPQSRSSPPGSPGPTSEADAAFLRYDQASSAPSIAAHDVTKAFENAVVALENVTIDVSEGEIVAIVGPSGCGKSTFLRLVAGLSPVTEGTISVHDSPVQGPRQDVGLMFQQPTLLPWKTARENVVMPRHFLAGDQGDAQAKADALLELVGLTGFEHTYPAHLSGGMQQRVALARLLIMGVDVMLLDEPFAAVDELTRERLNMEFLQIHEQVRSTVVLVTHNIAEAVFLADRLLVMTSRPGKLAASFEIDLPRPRKLEHMRAPEFSETAFAVREVLGTFETRAPTPEEEEAG